MSDPTLEGLSVTHVLEGTSELEFDPESSRLRSVDRKQTVPTVGRRSVWDTRFGNAAAKRMPRYRPSDPVDSLLVDDVAGPVPGDARHEELVPRRELTHTSQFSPDPVVSHVSPPRSIKVVEGATGWARHGVVMDPLERIRKSSAYETYKVELRRSGGELRRYPVVETPWAVCYVNTVWSPRNYCHWWTYYVARLAALHRIDLGGTKTAVLVAGTALTAERLAFVRYILPAGAELFHVSKYRRIRSGRTLILPPGRDFSAIAIDPCTLRQIRRWAGAFYSIADATDDSPKRIFISRRHGNRRRLRNEDELFDLLRRRGFERVALEEFSTREQIRMFAKASHIVGQHGAGLTNLMFSPPGTRVLELFSGETLHQFRFLSHAADLDYSSIAGDREHKNDDVEVSVDAVADWLAANAN